MHMFNTEKPGQPGVPEITEVKDGSISLKWTAPENDGGSPIFNYVLEYRREGAFKWLRSTEETTAALEYTVGKLQVDDQYEFRVAAENKAGVGPFSETTSPVQAKEPVCKSSFLTAILSSCGVIYSGLVGCCGLPNCSELCFSYIFFKIRFPHQCYSSFLSPSVTCL